MLPSATGSCPSCLPGEQDLALIYLKPLFRHSPSCHGLSYGWLWPFYSFCLECLPQLCLPDKCKIIFHGYPGFSTCHDQSYPSPMIKLTALPSNVSLFLHSHFLLYTQHCIIVCMCIHSMYVHLFPLHSSRTTAMTLLSLSPQYLTHCLAYKMHTNVCSKCGYVGGTVETVV